MGIMPGRREAEEGVQKPRLPPSPPRSLCVKRRCVFRSHVRTRERLGRAAGGRHVCVPFPACNADFRDFLTGSPSPSFPFSIQDLINAWIQFLRPFKEKDIVSLFLSSVTRAEKGAFEDGVDFNRSLSLAFQLCNVLFW